MIVEVLKNTDILFILSLLKIIGSWNDEFRASYMVAKNAPNLSEIDRYHLIQGAISRAQEAGVSIRPNEFMRRILYGY